MIQRSFCSFKSFKPLQPLHPQLILISGATGSGKSTLGMRISLSKGINQCVSTDNIRQVVRAYDKSSPALHRSSYEGDGDPIVNWKECCEVLQPGIRSVLEGSIRRKISIVIEGVHLIPSNELINLWTASGGVAMGIVMTIRNEEVHRRLIEHRGLIARRSEGDLPKEGASQQMAHFPNTRSAQMAHFPRIRAVQGEMARLAEKCDWLVCDESMGEEALEEVLRRVDRDNPSVHSLASLEDFVGGGGIHRGAHRMEENESHGEDDNYDNGGHKNIKKEEEREEEKYFSCYYDDNDDREERSD